MPTIHHSQSGWSGGHGGLLPCHRHCVTCPGNQLVDRDAHLDDVSNTRQMGPEQIGQLSKHPQALPLFFDLRLPQRIPQLDGLGRLDEERARAAGLIVNDPRWAAPRVSPHRNHVAVASHGDGGIGRGRSGIQSPEQGVQTAKQALAGPLDLFFSR